MNTDKLKKKSITVYTKSGPLKLPLRQSDIPRFWSKVEKSDSCWNWIAAKSSKGYGALRFKRVMATVSAHRLSHELFIGPVPPGLLVCHHCDNPACVRPSHLFLGTHKDNAMDCVAKGRNKTALGYLPRTVVLDRYKAEEIRRLRSSGVNTEALAVAFDVRPSTIRDVVSGRRWK